VRKVPDWVIWWLAAVAGVATVIWVGVQLVDQGMPSGSLAEWFAAVGTIGAVLIAVVLSLSERVHHRRRESFVEAAMVVLDVDMDAHTLVEAVGKVYGNRTVTGIVLPAGPAPIRNVRARMTWTSGNVEVDRRGHADGRSGEYQCRHLVAGAAAEWPFTITWSPEEPRPELESWTVTWVDRWNQWWSSTLGESRPHRIDPLDPVSPEWPQNL
jgi:hypothetical protein